MHEKSNVIASFVPHVASSSLYARSAMDIHVALYSLAEDYIRSYVEKIFISMKVGLCV